MSVLEWPEQFVNQLPNLKIIEPLHGLSTNRVWHAACEHGPIVVKASTSSVEMRFYCELRSILSDCAVATPTLFAAHSENARHWIAIEKVPHALPRERWLADAGVMDLLRNLHQCDLT